MSGSPGCIFCRIVSGEIPATKVYEDQHVTAFKDINPVAPVHILVIPNRHIESLAHVDACDQELMGHLVCSLSRIAADQGLSERGYRVVVNCGEEGGQTVPHLHFHLLGRRQLNWPPG